MFLRIDMKPEYLLKVLTGVGVGSRRRVADAIKYERVTVNGRVVTDFRHPVNVKKDQISIDGQLVNLKPKRVVTLMLNKPPGVISTVSDERGRRKVVDILPGKYRQLRLYPVGRLDKDSTGLLLLTNDGELAYHLTHPKFEYEKEYLIHIEGSLRPDELRKLEQGLRLEDGRTRPAKVKKVDSSPPYNHSITIHEGRNRQVRRMLDSQGHRVLALKRIRIGNLSLGNLREGNIRKLSAEEINALLNQF
jgi:23S rRNA pseudouridine2605 synthase